MKGVDCEVCRQSLSPDGFIGSNRSMDGHGSDCNDSASDFRQHSDQLVARAERIYRMRRRRAEIFSDSKLFGEPTYDLLLDLFIAAGRGRRVAISSGCVAADVPASTGLRTIRLLEDRGFLVRRADPLDGRRHFLELTPRALAALDTYLSL